MRDGALYHVSSRANRQEKLLDPESVKELFLEVLRGARAKYAFRIHNFCIMGNHFHLLIEPGKNESLSAMMQWILGVFAIRYNKRAGLTGHFWGERFFSRIVASIEEFKETIAYIDENPVSAGLVRHARDWRYGGLWHHRHGLRTIVDEASSLIMLLFPEHRQLQLE